MLQVSYCVVSYCSGFIVTHIPPIVANPSLYFLTIMIKYLAINLFILYLPIMSIKNLVLFTKDLITLPALVNLRYDLIRYYVLDSWIIESTILFRHLENERNTIN